MNDRTLNTLRGASDETRRSIAAVTAAATAAANLNDADKHAATELELCVMNTESTYIAAMEAAAHSLAAGVRRGSFDPMRAAGFMSVGCLSEALDTLREDLGVTSRHAALRVWNAPTRKLAALEILSYLADEWASGNYYAAELALECIATGVQA
jgi:hypothetical protein